MHEVLIAHQQPIQPATAVRSTVLQSSLTTLRTRGHFDAWSALIEPQHRATIVDSVAPGWLPMEVGLAHYLACERLALPAQEQLAMGEAVSDRIQGSFLATLMKSARQAGFNPMVILAQFDRLYGRLFQGGSVQIVQLGPKDVDIEVKGLALVRIAYFRVAFTGVVRGGVGFSGARACHVKQQSWSDQNDQFVMRASWV